MALTLAERVAAGQGQLAHADQVVVNGMVILVQWEFQRTSLRTPIVAIAVAPPMPLPPPDDLPQRFVLTTREAQVARLLADRCSNREIARYLGVTEHTARRHTEKVLLKLNVHSRTAVRNRLCELTGFRANSVRNSTRS